MRQFYLTFQKSQPMADQLTWTNLSILLPIKDENKRNYYINICIKENLSKRNLISLIKSNTYERLSYKDKSNIKIISNEDGLSIEDMIKDPIYIKIDKKIDKLNEKVLKEIILEKIESYFIELGYGYAFVGSEVRLELSYCDLLFYNYELNCFIVVEVKIRSLRKEDIGQIEYYMNYIDVNKRKEYMGKTIGIILCKEGNCLVMKYCSNSYIFNVSYELV